VPLLSVPARLGTTVASVPAAVPYLSADPVRIEKWREVLAVHDGFRVGIAWQGSPTMLPYDRWRSYPLARLEPLARVEGVRLISLQQGSGSEQIASLGGRFPVVDLGSQLDDSAGAFVETAALIANLDLVIACDTALAHLAGALGIAAWVLLPMVPNWRWLLDRDDTPWYPTVRLFRQTSPGAWDDPIRRMGEALRLLTPAARPPRPHSL
jgi:hypothetical protein